MESHLAVLPKLNLKPRVIPPQLRSVHQLAPSRGRRYTVGARAPLVYHVTDNAP
jgi:hypothetical protein